MNFSQLSTGDAVFLDANVLVYYFQPHPLLGSACHQLIQRIENQDLAGFTATHLLSEVAHRLMGLEASQLPGSPSKNIGQWLGQNPSVVQRLNLFRTAVDSILQSRIQVLPIAADLVGAATVVSQHYGLLTTDATLVAAMDHQGLTKLASHDSDFDRVPNITRYAPN